MLVPIFHEFCRILNWFYLLCHILRHKNVNYAQVSYSNLQLPAYTNCRSLQKITNLMVRHLTRPYFLESCGSKILLWRCYATKEESILRIKVTKIILAEKNAPIGYAVSFKHMLQTCFISQNCEKGFSICLCDSWSLLDLRHVFLILLSWLLNHVQSQQHNIWWLVAR